MDANLTGKFIAELRRQKGYTQKELADKLMVTDKAISRWETGKGLPETSLLKPLADILGVSVGELLSGKIIEESQIKEENDKVIVDALKYSGKMFSDMINLLLFLVGGALLLSLSFVSGDNYYWPFGIVLIVIGAVRVYLKKKGKAIKLNDKTVYAVGIAFQVIAFIFELLPYGAVLNFAGGPDGTDTFRETFSYFDIRPLGYANLSPMITGILTVISVIFGIVAICKFEKWTKIKKRAFACSAFAAAFSLIPLILFGTNYMTAVSYIVSAAIAVSVCLQAIANRNDR